jgi:hypothetical protein
MDNFTLAVVVGDIVMAIAFVLLIVLDKKDAKVAADPMKPTGKRS